jgi:hypothetical protein
MFRASVLICSLFILLPFEVAHGQSIPVEVVATASEYVPISTTVSHPEHAYSDCTGTSSYFALFHDYGDSGTINGTADTTTKCSATFSPPRESSMANYNRVNYMIGKGENALYLLSCTQRVDNDGFGADTHASGEIEPLKVTEARLPIHRKKSNNNAAGTWTACPAFAVGSRYTLEIFQNTTDVLLQDKSGGQLIKLNYRGSSTLPKEDGKAATQPVSPAEKAILHVTSSPSGAGIYIDGKFFGDTPSDIILVSGEHSVKLSLNGTEWFRSVQVTTGQVQLHAEMAQK